MIRPRNTAEILRDPADGGWRRLWIPCFCATLVLDPVAAQTIAASNTGAFAMTAEVLGAVVSGAVAEVITGSEEAELSFRGAVGELDSAAGPFVVVDLGGGSTEVVLGSADSAEVAAGYSADIGCVRLTERCLHSDPPTADEIESARAVVRSALEEALQRAGAAAEGLAESGQDPVRDRAGRHDTVPVMVEGSVGSSSLSSSFATCIPQSCSRWCGDSPSMTPVSG